MKLRNVLALGLGGAALALLLVEPSLAQTPTVEAAPAAAAAAPVPNKGDTAWMLISSALVLMMSVPGLALFYGGLVRTKNMLSLLTQVFAIVCVACIVWVFFGYSLAFTNGGGLNDFVGGFSKAFLRGVDANSVAATFSNGVVIPEYVYICFQMTFAMITPALIVGAFAERMKFSALLLFSTLWLIFIYFPMAHMVWYWGGPDAVGNAAKALAAATDEASKKAAQDALDAVNADAGLLFKWGALDFAGGTVVHINAGIAGIVGCLMLGKRIGYGRDLLAPHSLTMTMIGASLLWVGWFGFNAGSNLEANGSAALAMINTFVATAAAGLSWLLVEWAAKGKPSLLGMLSGAVAGLVAVTPACGFAGPMGSIVLGLVAGAVCFVMCSTVKNALGYDDSLDVFGVHCVGGILGALATGILVNPALGGVGAPDYATKPGELVAAAYEFGPAFLAQAKAVGFTIIWSGVGSAILYKIVDVVVGLRVTQDEEREGLDLADHGERAYNY
ncbi:ammonia channel protein [Methylobacterium indicum]|uniref:Ammonium transporter n=1 Tax=Methylobacterium indicum TaxID=1775910 RepID=A0ABR5GY74_9HYPH|nr:ammonium transporter [Methylobacterium indicum]KMO15125.1 ammonia channel protein [Methylobacterium indicum]KMO22268.1 ammonia channel protein [Methylobacterium indicum]KTS15310.1 ammonia channel protein [Methylobacterium indicum]KTS22785.1 ammonia channel protein [Methylobacterium indicum]KTS49501.1 ammonia channel protein [Methylobacterium indicum]